MSEILIHGSTGEGGGQILRSSLALSALTGKPFEIDEIRAKRPKPGLMRQHLTAVQATAQICRGQTDGAELRSSRMRFAPGPVRGGEYEFAVGTAGSACLVLQTVLLPLLFAKESSRVTLEGGTHNPFAPPFDFLIDTFLPVLRRMGANVSATLKKPGFYPAGGGRIVVEIEPCASLHPLDLTERGQVRVQSARVLLSNLPAVIAEREIEYLQRDLGLAPELCEVVHVESPGPGNVIFVRISDGEHTEVFSGFGIEGVSAGRVVGDLAKSIQGYLSGHAPVSSALADQLILPFALAGTSTFATVGVTNHTRTNVGVVSQFLDRQIQIEPFERGLNVLRF